MHAWCDCCNPAISAATLRDAGAKAGFRGVTTKGYACLPTYQTYGTSRYRTVFA
jgi:hypothetical protein